MVLPILPYYLALVIGRRTGVGGITQFLFSLPRRVGGDGPGGALIGRGRVVAFALPPRVTAVLFTPRPPWRHY